jgi:hypothetical protein
MKAEYYINVGYQRLLTFEVRPGGGFEWWGRAPANIVLSAIGLLQFTDMAKVYEIDERIIDRTRNFILSKQNKDGSWSLDRGRTAWSWKGLSGTFVVTSYVAWSLAEAGYQGKALNKAVEFIIKHLDEAGGTYGLALAANVLAAVRPDEDVTYSLLNKLDSMKKENTDWNSVSWSSGGQTVTYASGGHADIETTALVAMAMMRTGRYANTINRALTHLVKTKDGRGTWGSTSATILALKALLKGLGGQPQKEDVTITVRVNDITETLTVTPEQSDVMRVIDFKNFTCKGENRVKISIKGKGNFMYQLVGRYYLPWDKVKPEQEEKPLEIELTYDRTTLSKDDILNAHVELTYKGKQPTFMIVLDLGIPPGFDVDAGAFAELVKQKKIERFGVTARQITIYLGRVMPGQVLEFDYQLRARYPIRAKTPKSTAYEYYTPTNRDTVEPVELVVKE